MITTERAAEAVQRLINSHFGNDNRARCSIPADRANDDDLVASDFVQQQAALHESHKRLMEALEKIKDESDHDDNLNLLLPHKVVAQIHETAKEALRLARELE